MEPTLDAAPFGFFRLADDGTMAYVNRTFAALLRTTPEALLGQPLDASLSAGARIFLQTHLLPLLRLHGRADEVYLTFRAADGEAVPVLLNALRRADGASDVAVAPMRRRSQFEEELLQARKAAEAAAEAKARFLSMMSHDLRAPLSGICMAAEVLAAGPVTDQQRCDLGQIREAGEYVLRLLTDILTFARLDAGRADLRAVPVPLAEALARAEAVVRPLAEHAGLRFEPAECPGDARALGSPDRLQQVLLNLLTNAVKFTAPGGRIGLACVVGERSVAIHVRDTGRGIADEHLEPIFDPFTQLDAAGPREGVGLGLAISRALTRAMGGELTVASRLGEGSTFTVTLPRPEAASA